ncbi:MAG: hypothetical protein GWN84_00720 [Gammaproteobacteria bacterium]|nr:hypothetical protein [Gammaproteobacteria bacterium]NIR81721.1 hypothetical protein [Gammaproteobacteria bacterium]NIR88524.1 hypothetical protein [Gammaproteobacteria bacterium]NIU02828.1 hypothetical protein [Gammaproteobacteria bacterium]NIV50350.1 hypothetical protein [Gammaproteobacteria bacterium]
MNTYLPRFVVDTIAQPDCSSEGHGEIVAAVVDKFRSFPRAHYFLTYTNVLGDGDVYRIFNLYETAAEANDCLTLAHIEKGFGPRAAAGLRAALGKHHCRGVNYMPEYSNACDARAEPPRYLFHATLKFKCAPYEKHEAVKSFVSTLRSDKGSPNFLVYQGVSGSAAESHVIVPLDKLSDCAVGGRAFEYSISESGAASKAKVAWDDIAESIVSCSGNVLTYLPELSNPPRLH